MAATGGVPTFGFWVALVCQCLLLYPASHAFNSYYDKDTGPIAGVPVPPKVDGKLLAVAWALDAMAVGLGLLIGKEYAAWLLIYGLVSKAYSHPATRWKARPWISWSVVSLFQGGSTLIFSANAISGIPVADLVVDPFWKSLALLATLWIASFYPITQIYQHDEDAQRGDLTLSRKLGAAGTWRFAAWVGLASAAVLVFISVRFHRWDLLLAIAVGALPTLKQLPRGENFQRPDHQTVSALAWAASTGMNLSLIALSLLSWVSKR